MSSRMRRETHPAVARATAATAVRSSSRCDVCSSSGRESDTCKAPSLAPFVCAADPESDVVSDESLDGEVKRECTVAEVWRFASDSALASARRSESVGSTA
jgi:hypothetical protein